MDDLRSRFRRLISISSDALRLLEHKTFNRLLYRNRQQHRHGFYFRRLEHVRRLVAKITSHVVWNSVQHALGEDNSNDRSKKKPPLALSSITVEDLKSVESLLKILVARVIPMTAVRVTTELICRRHFLPFAVAIVACLARLFVIERKLMAEVRGALVEARLLLGIEEGVDGREQQNGNERKVVEDIGEEVEPTNVSGQVVRDVGDKAGGGAVSLRKDNTGEIRIAENESALLRPLKRQRVSSDGENAERVEEEAPSLYTLMARYDRGAASVAQSTTRFAGGNLTALASERVEGDGNGDVSDWVARNIVKTEVPEVVEASTAVQGARDTSHTSLQLRGKDTHIAPRQAKSNACVGRSLSQTSKADSNSDSEDIDDIFGALED